MQNTVVLESKKNHKISFDLKGSSVGRKIKFNLESEKFWLSNLNHKQVMKDKNYMEINTDLNHSLMKLSQSQFN
jgi:hypothetical protein